MLEFLVILFIVLLVFAPGKLPAIGDALGRTVKSFKKGFSGDDKSGGAR